MARLEVITGPMFSGKSEELVRRLRRATFIDRKIVLVKPKTNKREQRNTIDLVLQNERLANYNYLRMASIDTAQELDKLIITFEPDIVAMDELQLLVALDGGEAVAYEFLDYIISALEKRKETKFRIIVAGLDMDAWGRPFGIMPDLMARADEVVKLTAECTKCNGANPAIFTQKIGGSSKLIEEGDTDKYTARCRVCYTKPKLPGLDEPRP